MNNSKSTCLQQAGLQAFLKAYNFAKRLKTLKGLTPYEEVIEGWHKEPERFTINPLQHTAGLYNYPGESLAEMVILTLPLVFAFHSVS